MVCFGMCVEEVINLGNGLCRGSLFLKRVLGEESGGGEYWELRTYLYVWAC